jgi:histone arginine demethylase JMJD6
MAMLNPLPLETNSFPSHFHPLERRSNLTFQEFARNYLYPNRPVILTDASKGWRALTRWNPDFFIREFGDRQVALGKDKKRFKSTVKDFMEYCKTFTEVYTGKRVENRPYYLRNVVVGNIFPELLGDFKVHDFFLPNWLERWPLKRFLPLAESSSSELFVGPPGASVPAIHRDRFMTHSWLSQVAGEKAFWAVSPQENELMYQNAENPNHSMVNSMVEPDLKRFPLFARAKIYSDVLRPGETVFIPAGWWHTAECLNLSISLSGNFVNHSNFSLFRDITTLPAFEGRGRMKKILNRAVLRAHGIAYSMQDAHLIPRAVPRRARLKVLAK